MMSKSKSWPAHAVLTAQEYCMEDGPYGMLAAAIVIQAAHDYSSALNPAAHAGMEDWTRRRMVRNVESFVRGRWFSQLTTLDGEYLLRRLRQEARKEASKHDKR